MTWTSCSKILWNVKTDNKKVLTFTSTSWRHRISHVFINTELKIDIWKGSTAMSPSEFRFPGVSITCGQLPGVFITRRFRLQGVKTPVRHDSPLYLWVGSHDGRIWGNSLVYTPLECHDSLLCCHYRHWRVVSLSNQQYPPVFTGSVMFAITAEGGPWK